MRFARANGNVIAGGSAQAAQHGHQQRGRGLPIDIEIPPDPDALTGFQGMLDTPAGRVHPRQVIRRGRGVAVRVEEGQGCIRQGEPAAGQHLGNKRVAADGFLQRGGDGRLGRVDPNGHSISLTERAFNNK